jgi:CBS domain containing-hemolysin-like protein
LVRLLIPAGADAAALENKARITRKDILFLLSRESGATPDLGEQRRRMVIGVFALSDKTARDVMIPRERMLRITPDMPMREILELASRSRVKSFPVWSESDQRFTGILKVSDLFEHIDDPDLRLPDLIRPPQYIDSDMPADDLLPRLRMSRQPMLLIRGDGGQVIGFVTSEVVLEEIVGPLYER